MRFYPLFAAFLPAFAWAAEPGALNVSVTGLNPDGSIPAKFAFCQPDKEKRTKDGGNISPEVRWSKGPKNTSSYVIIMHDPDVPAKLDDANKEGKTLPKTRQNQIFYHWVLADIAPIILSIPEGGDSKAVQNPGKPAIRTDYGLRGANDYGKFMGGSFAGYDGPCPPWNDEAVHHYTFTVYALDIPSLKLKGPFTAQQALGAMQGHILAKGTAMGTYTQNIDITNN